MATKKNVAKGKRVLVEWGSVKLKSGGKTTNQKVYSRVIKSVADAMGLKEAKAPANTIRKNKKGSQYLGGISVARGASKYVLVSVGETAKAKTKGGADREIFHRVPIPRGISMAKASAILVKAGKAKTIKFPNGTPKPIGKGK